MPVVVALALVMAAAAAALVQVGDDSSAAHGDSGGSVLRSRICLLDDLDGDGAGEIAGLLSPDYDSPLVPTILNGVSGRTQWQGEALEGEESDLALLCLGPDWFGVANDASFSLLLVHAREQRTLRHALSDSLQRFGRSDECFRFETSDERSAGFSTSDGSPRECDALASARPPIEETTTCGIIGTMPEGARVHGAAGTLHLVGRSPGTALLELTASADGQEQWSETLRLVPVGGDSIGCFAAVAAPGTYVVLGAPQSDDSAITALGLQADTGVERFATELDTSFGLVRGLYFNGRYVVVGLVGDVAALDPATGRVAW